MFLLFLWFQGMSKDNYFFLELMFFSFVFAGSATLVLLSSDIEHASKRLRCVFYGFTAIAIVVILGVAFFIANIPAGGTHHYYFFTPENAEINLNYGWTRSGKAGYSGRLDQKLLEADYPIGGAWVYYELHGVHIYTDKDVYANVTIWFYLGFWPNGKDYRSIYDLEEETAMHDGKESSVSFKDSTFTIFWGAGGPGSRDRLDKGYAVNLILEVEFEGPYIGDLKCTVPFYPGVHIDDIQVSSQIQDGMAIFLCGALAGALCYLFAKGLKPKITESLAPQLICVKRLFTSEQRGYLKKCVQCGRDIPLASEKCPYCEAKQPEYRV
jgi:hypothetical protein